MSKTVIIGGTPVGPGHPCYIIAEIGINHNGDTEIAKALIDVAVKAGANAVKFQTRDVATVYTEAELAKAREVPRPILEKAIARGVLSHEAVDRLHKSGFKASTNGDLKRLLEFTDEEYRQINEYCGTNGIAWLTSCWDTVSFRRMSALFDFPAHKIASACNEDDELLRLAKASGRPIILSTGMTDLQGVRDALRVTGTDDAVLLHCTSVYPLASGRPEEILRMINLQGIETLAKEFGVPVGLSSHDSGIQPTYAAVVLGAAVIEKHITLERGSFGSDQGSSMEPDDFGRLCRMVREIPLAMGSGSIEIYPEEVPVATKLRRVRRLIT